eukprot:UC4_evm1s776
MAESQNLVFVASNVRTKAADGKTKISGTLQITAATDAPEPSRSQALIRLDTGISRSSSDPSTYFEPFSITSHTAIKVNRQKKKIMVLDSSLGRGSTVFQFNNQNTASDDMVRAEETILQQVRGLLAASTSKNRPKDSQSSHKLSSISQHTKDRTPPPLGASPLHSMKVDILNQDEQTLNNMHDLVMVDGAPLSRDSFWDEGRAQELLEDKLQASKEAKQPVAPNSGLLAILRPRSEGGIIRYNLNPIAIAQIFSAYPNLKKRFDEMVPTKQTEKEFWTEFIQAQAFMQHRHTDKQSENVSKEMYRETEYSLEELDPLASKDKNRKRRRLHTSLAGLADTEDLKEDGFGVRPTPLDFVHVGNDSKKAMNYTSGKDFDTAIAKEGSVNRSKVARQFNSHSIKTLNSMSSQSSANDERDVRGILRDMTRIEDLEEKTRPQFKTFTLNRSLYVNKFTSSSAQRGEVKCTSENRLFPLRSQRCLVPASPALHTCDKVTNDVPFPAEQAYQDITRAYQPDTPCRNLPAEDLRIKIVDHYMKITEVLRHFWAIFPWKKHKDSEKKKFLAKKMTNLIEFLRTQKSNIKSWIHDQNENNKEDITDLMAPIVLSIDKALIKHDNFKKSFKKSKLT